MISTFALSVGVPIGIANSAIKIKICEITAGIKKCKLIIKKKREKHDKIVLLANTKLSTIEVMISKAFTDLYINHEDFVSVNNGLREHNEMKEEIKNFESAVEYVI